jgi:hypothetical protein
MDNRIYSSKRTNFRCFVVVNRFVRSSVLIAIVILFACESVSGTQESQINKIPIVTVITEEGNQVPGRVLDVADSALILGCRKEPSSGHNCNEHSQRFHYSEINHIIIEEKGNIVSGVAIGTLVGTTFGLFSSQLVPVTWTNVDWSPFEMAETMLSTPMVLTGAFLGGVAGVLQGIDTKIRINGDIELFRNAIPILQVIRLEERDSLCEQ